MAIFLFIFFLLLTAYCLLVDYYRRGWNSIPEQDFPEVPTVRVSVVVAVRNEEGNIGILLDCLGRQDYPQHLFEVVIADDHSSDNTAGIAGKFPFVRLLQLPVLAEGKKQ